jgi:hypothetical protein
VHDELARGRGGSPTRQRADENRDLRAPRPSCYARFRGAGRRSVQFHADRQAFDERCVHLEREASLAYHFRSTSPVDFNIHYERGNDVFFPVRQTGIKEANGTFRADTADDYCLMWERAGSGSGRDRRFARTRARTAPGRPRPRNSP